MAAKQYAKALLMVGNENDNLLAIKEQFDLFMEILKDENELFLVLTSLISLDSKKSILQTALKDFERVFVLFLYVLIDNKRFKDIYDIHTEFVNIYNEQLGLTVINVYSAKPITDSKDDIEKLARKYFKVRKIQLHYIEDDTILNGYKLEYNGEYLDLSGKADIYKIKSSL